MQNLLILFSCALLFGCGVSSASNTSHTHNHDTDTAAIYSVNQKDLTITFKSGVVSDENFSPWKKVIQILPNAYLKKHVAEYHVFSDGANNNLAYITNMDYDDSKWIFAIDYKDSINLDSEGNEEFVATIIHEFSHIISLEIGQVDREYESCTTYEIDEGCTKEGSFLYEFYQKFWQGKVDDKYQQYLQRLSEKDQENVMTKFYESHTEKFVNEYSATNTVEDFAESFSFFVLSDKVAKPTTLKDEKINFFYEFPELVAIRDHVRAHTTVRK